MSLLILLGNISVTVTILFALCLVGFLLLFVCLFRVRCPSFDKVLFSFKSTVLFSKINFPMYYEIYFVFHFVLAPHPWQRDGGEPCHSLAWAPHCHFIRGFLLHGGVTERCRAAAAIWSDCGGCRAVVKWSENTDEQRMLWMLWRFCQGGNISM